MDTQTMTGSERLPRLGAAFETDVGKPSEWPGIGECSYEDPELWFSTDPEDQAYAASICAGCLVRVQCLKWATDTEAGHGIWGGFDFSTAPALAVKQLMGVSA